MSRDRALSLAGFVLMAVLGVAAFTVTNAWWQRVLLLIVALALGWMAFGVRARASLTACAGRVLRSVASRDDRVVLAGLSPSARDEAFRRAHAAMDQGAFPRTGDPANLLTDSERERLTRLRRSRGGGSPCPCCECLTLRSSRDSCPVCGWVTGGKNHVSLEKARATFELIGAAEMQLVKYVRGPRLDERPTAKSVVYQLDGDRFSSLDGFFQEITRVLSLKPWGHSLEEYDHVLFNVPRDGFILWWKNHETSREQLGYRPTMLQLEHMLPRAQLYKRMYVETAVDDAREGKGPTVFDWLVDITQDHAPDLELILD
jgi:hypothetical protein